MQQDMKIAPGLRFAIDNLEGINKGQNAGRDLWQVGYEDHDGKTHDISLDVRKLFIGSERGGVLFAQDPVGKFPKVFYCHSGGVVNTLFSSRSPSEHLFGVILQKRHLQVLNPEVLADPESIKTALQDTEIWNATMGYAVVGDEMRELEEEVGRFKVRLRTIKTGNLTLSVGEMLGRPIQHIATEVPLDALEYSDQLSAHVLRPEVLIENVTEKAQEGISKCIFVPFYDERITTTPDPMTLAGIQLALAHLESLKR